MEKPKVLLVDDSPTVLLFEKMVLGSQYKIVEAKNGKLALEAAKREKPNLILMDIMMPEMSGIEALEAMRQIDDLKETPIIMVTTKSDEDRVKACFELGCTDYVNKPIDKIELLSKVKNNLNSQSSK